MKHFGGGQSDASPTSGSMAHSIGPASEIGTRAHSSSPRLGAHEVTHLISMSIMFLLALLLCLPVVAHFSVEPFILVFLHDVVLKHVKHKTVQIA